MSGLEVVILCGGRGTRAHPDTVELPKPLLPVGAMPIVEHVMQIYASQGHKRFVLAAGYLGDMIAARFSAPPNDWEIRVIDTGDDTETGDRLRLASSVVQGERFFATYADGLADIDLSALLRCHDRHRGLLTVTTVPLPSQYGTMLMDDTGRVTDFREKPRLADHWINAGFFVVDRRVFELWHGHVLEQDVLPGLSAEGLLYAYRHRGFWKSMDTFKDRQELDSLVEEGTAPWMQSALDPHS